MAKGWLLQFALIVVELPAAGVAGFAAGAQTGTLPVPLMQVSVCAGGVPDNAKPLQVGSLKLSVPGPDDAVTVSVKLCTASGRTPLLAVNCMG